MPSDPVLPLRVITDYADELDDPDKLNRLPASAAVAPLGPADHRTTPRHLSAAGGFGWGPLDEQGAWTSVQAALQQAADAGAQVAVIPELNLGATAPGRIYVYPGTSPYLTLCGSRHMLTKSGDQVNETALLLDGHEVLTHRKLQPMTSAEPSEREDIVPGSQLSVVISQRWTVAALICADVNWNEVSRALEDLGANLVLVASMSPKMGFFPTTLANLSARNQALVVWANDPAGGTTQVNNAMFIFPSAPDSAGKATDVYAERGSLPDTWLHDWSAGR